MKISNITINNFQSYYHEQSLDFSDGLNLVIGNGGKGKSKLFNAFYWVLFGKIYITGIGWCSTDTLPSSAKFSMKRHEFINKKALYEAEIGEEVTASVQIELEDDKGLRYEIERSVGAMRKDCDDWKLDDAWDVKSCIVKILYDTPTGTKVVNDMFAEDKINELFPDGIRNYIWFQGESLENLINFRDKSKLKAAVSHISYFPYYEKLSKIISISTEKIAKMERQRLKDVNKHNESVKGILATLENLNYKLTKERETKANLETDIDRIQVALAEGDNKISGLASYSKLVKQYKDCEIRIEKYIAETTKIDNFQRDKLPTLWILRGIEPMLDQCKQIIEDHKEEEATVPEKKYLDNPSRIKLEEILRDKKCFICGTEFTEKDAQYHYIQERMRLQEEYLKEMEEYTNNMQFSKQFNMFVGKIEDYPHSLKLAISQIDKQWQESEDDMEKYLALRRKNQDEKKTYDRQIEEIKKKYNVDPVRQAETADIITSSNRVSRTKLETQKQKLAASKKLISEYEVAIRKEENELSKIGSKDKTVESVAETEWKNISIFLEDVCKRVQENARKELLHKIEVRANEFYAKFTEHDNGYKGTVKIGDDYSIEFDAGLNTSHEDRKKMSIINALLSLNQEALGIYYPFISDAPTSSFDIETTHKYLLGIKDIFGQSIIMTKDVEIDSEQYKDLINQNNVSRVYSLESEVYCDHDNPDLHEVSTKVITLK